MNEVPSPSTTLGILSGHSALAGSCFHARFLERVRMRGVTQDQAYPRVIHWSTPLDGLDDAGLAAGIGAHNLSRELVALDFFDPAFVAVTCNSLAQLVNECRAAGNSAAVAQTPVHAVNTRPFSGSVLVLAAGNARRYEMVRPAAFRVDYPVDSAQRWVLDITQAVRSQGLTPALQMELRNFLKGDLARQYGSVVLACTELSALWPDTPAMSDRSADFVVDSMACLLDDAVAALMAQYAME